MKAVLFRGASGLRIRDVEDAHKSIVQNGKLPILRHAVTFKDKQQSESRLGSGVAREKREKFTAPSEILCVR